MSIASYFSIKPNKKNNELFTDEELKEIKIHDETKWDSPYGYVNDTVVYSRYDWIMAITHRDHAIEDDNELLEYATKVSHGFYNAGHKNTFTAAYLSDYALDEPYRSLTHWEFARLKNLQIKAREEYDAKEKAREWKLIETIGWADNSIEEIWEDKDGIKKTIMVVQPHGDVCY